MRSRLEPAEKPLHWIGSSKRDLLDMPEPVVREIGIALSVVQFGSKHPNAKPWMGLGPGVLELVSNFATNTFRAVYVVRFEKGTSMFCIALKRNLRAEFARQKLMLRWSRSD